MVLRNNFCGQMNKFFRSGQLNGILYSLVLLLSVGRRLLLSWLALHTITALLSCRADFDPCTVVPLLMSCSSVALSLALPTLPFPRAAILTPVTGTGLQVWWWLKRARKRTQ